MTGTLRQLRRTPVRLAATVAALALSVAALGVLAVPAVSSDGLRALAARDLLTHLAVDTTPLSDPSVLEGLPGVTAAEARVSGTVELPPGDAVSVVGIDPADQSVDVLRPSQGRLPEVAGEVLVTPALAASGVAVGDDLPSLGGELRVVGIGTTAAYEVDPVMVMTPKGAAGLLGVTGPTRVALRVEDPTQATLEATTEDLRRALAAQGAAFTGFPELFVDGAHPLESEITMVSVMIGMLGIVAGIVALVLLATTTASIISERSQQTAVARAIGTGPRATRAALRRLALVTAGLAALVGVPLGIAVANVIARMVLERFAGITPGLVLSLPLVVASVAFLLVGARVVSAPAARRAVAVPLVSALRDRDGVPYGSRWWQRAGGRVGTWLRLPEPIRAAGRNGLWRPGRTTGLVLQVASGVAVVLIVASLGTSLAEFDEAELEPWSFGTMTATIDTSGGWPVAIEEGAPTSIGADPSEETGLHVMGSVAATEADVFGMAAGTTVLDTAVSSGRWLSASGTAGPDVPEAVVTAGFAERRGIEVGDRVALTVPSGAHDVDVVGLHRLRSIAVFVERGELATLLGRPDEANVVWSHGEPGVIAAAAGDLAATSTVSASELSAEDRSARAMIMGIFWAIGIVVVSVATIGFASSVQMLVHDRRRELATVRAVGGSAGVVRRMLVAEVVPVALVGVLVGGVSAHLGARALMSAVESAEGLEIGYSFAGGVVVPVATAALLVTVTLALIATRAVLLRSPALTLRAVS